MFGIGRNLIASITFNGKEYNFVILYNPDMVKNWIPQFIQGDITIPTPNILWLGDVIDPSWDETFHRPAQDIVLAEITQLNLFMKNYFGGTMPDTWEEQLETFFRKVRIALEGGIPQAKMVT